MLNLLSQVTFGASIAAGLGAAYVNDLIADVATWLLELSRLLHLPKHMKRKLSTPLVKR